MFRIFASRVSILTFVLSWLLWGGCGSGPAVVRGPYPNNCDLKEADKNFYLGNYQEAIASYEAFIQNSSPDIASGAYRPYARYKIGVCYLALGDYDRAMETFNRALTERPEPELQAEIWSDLAKGHLFKKEYPAAAECYKKVLAIPDEALPRDEVLFNLATALMRSDRWEEGSGYFNRLVKQYPDSPRARNAKERLNLPPHTFIVQLSRYDNKENARKELAELRGNKEINASLKTMLIDGDEVYFIWAGTFSSWREAAGKAEELQAKGIEAMVVP